MPSVQRKRKVTNFHACQSFRNRLLDLDLSLATRDWSLVTQQAIQREASQYPALPAHWCALAKRVRGLLKLGVPATRILKQLGSSSLPTASPASSLTTASSTSLQSASPASSDRILFVLLCSGIASDDQFARWCERSGLDSSPASHN